MAFDRALRLVKEEQIPADHAEDWREEADAIRAFVEAECWSEERRSYVMHPGSDKLDAAVLRVARMSYLEADDERLHGTIDAIRDELGAGSGLVYRYSGQQGVEGCFVACSFWLVEALARAGRLAEARTTMNELVGLANDVGLFAEEIDPDTHEHLGNFPQALSHLALVNAAAAIEEES